jgi:hypothetical protein
MPKLLLLEWNPISIIQTGCNINLRVNLELVLELLLKDLFVYCWGPSASEGPQKRNLIMSSNKNM